jgi:ferrochelatase
VQLDAFIPDALIVVSFGGPEQPADVIPFLENVTRGRGIPRERLLEVAEHYYHFGGRSPINDQNRALIAALQKLLDREGPRIPVYWGNRNWHPFLAETVRQMKEDGIRRAAAFITSAFGSYSGCRQYRNDILKAREDVGEGAPEIEPLKLFFDQPGFLDPMTDNIRAALGQFSSAPVLAFTAHSVPISMASTGPYVQQLEWTCRTIAGRLGREDWKLVYQSRSGPPTQPWLEPDILDYIRRLHVEGRSELVIAPVGFTSDHLEVVYDLDTEAAQLCRDLDITTVRAATVGTDPRFVWMIRDLITTRRVCAPDCCPKPQRPVAFSGPPAAGTVQPGS